MSDSDPTDAELLLLVKQAISGTLTRNAAQLSTAARRIVSLSLMELIKLRNDLEQRIARVTTPRHAAVARFRGPS